MGALVKHLSRVGKERGQEGHDLRMFVGELLRQSFSLTPDLLYLLRLVSPLGDGSLPVSSLDEFLLPAIVLRRQEWDLDGPSDAWYAGLKKSTPELLLRSANSSRACGISQTCWDSLSDTDRTTIIMLETSRLSLGEDVTILAKLVEALQTQIH